jgi:hypothetical protein
MVKNQSGERRKVAIHTGKPWRQVLEELLHDEWDILLTATPPENAM